MALANKKYESLFDKIGSGKKRLSDNKQTEISASFASGIISEDPTSPDSLQGLIYMMQEMQEDIDEIRRYITNEATGSAVKSIKSVNVSDLPTRSVGLTSGLLYVDVKDNNRLKKA